MIKQTKFVPKVYNQGKTSMCYAYALGSLIEFLNQEKGVKVELDILEFYKRVTDPANGINLPENYLNEARDKGLKDKSGGYHKINYEYIQRKDIALRMTGEVGLILVLDLEDGENFRWRIDGEGVVKKRLTGFHGVACIEVVDKRYAVCVNSWGEDFGKNGYFYIDLPRTKNIPILNQYLITLK